MILEPEYLNTQFKSMLAHPDVSSPTAYTLLSISIYEEVLFLPYHLHCGDGKLHSLWRLQREVSSHTLQMQCLSNYKVSTIYKPQNDLVPSLNTSDLVTVRVIST